jgi:aminomethyltransferase
MTNATGGIIDDTVITKVTEDNIYVVLNGGCADKDKAHINKHLAVAKAKGMVGRCGLTLTNPR